MHHYACPAPPGMMRSLGAQAKAKAAASKAAPPHRARRASAAAACVAGALLLVLAAAPAHASGGSAPSSQHRSGPEPSTRSPRGNQTTGAGPAPPPAPELWGPLRAGSLQDRARAWRANKTAARAAHGHIERWDTAGETDLTGAFDNATFNGDLNRFVFLP